MKPIKLMQVKKSDPKLQECMIRHYSDPMGFVGRQLFYLVRVDNVVYGAIAAGSATRFLPGREAFFGQKIPLGNLVSNTFFHIEKFEGRYPMYNFASRVVAVWRRRVAADWQSFYGSAVLGWECLVELPRLGTLYLQDHWTEVGITKGFTCKRTGVGAEGTDSWSGARVWDTENLRPKRVFVRGVTP